MHSTPNAFFTFKFDAKIYPRWRIFNTMIIRKRFTFGPLYRVAQKSKPLPNNKIIVLNRI